MVFQNEELAHDVNIFIQVLVFDPARLHHRISEVATHPFSKRVGHCNALLIFQRLRLGFLLEDVESFDILASQLLANSSTDLRYAKPTSLHLDTVCRFTLQSVSL